MPPRVMVASPMTARALQTFNVFVFISSLMVKHPVFGCGLPPSALWAAAVDESRCVALLYVSGGKVPQVV